MYYAVASGVYLALNTRRQKPSVVREPITQGIRQARVDGDVPHRWSGHQTICLGARTKQGRANTIFRMIS